MDETSPKLEEIIQFYLDHKNKTTQIDLSLNNSLIAFRSNDSSMFDSSQNSTFLSESTADSDDSPIGPKRKRKESKSDLASLPSNKRSK